MLSEHSNKIVQLGNSKMASTGLQVMEIRILISDRFDRYPSMMTIMFHDSWIFVKQSSKFDNPLQSVITVY